MWLRKPLYEALPFVYMSVGLVGVGVSFLLEEGYGSYALLFAGLALLTGGLVLWLKRRDYRLSRSRSGLEDLR